MRLRSQPYLPVTKQQSYIKSCDVRICSRLVIGCRRSRMAMRSARLSARLSARSGGGDSPPPSIRRACASKKLVLRDGSSLDSMKVGDIEVGQAVLLIGDAQMSPIKHVTCVRHRVMKAGDPKEEGHTESLRPFVQRGPPVN